MTEQDGHIKGKFAASNDPAVHIPARVNLKTVGVGKTYLFEADLIPVTDGHKLFGCDAFEFAKMEKPMQEAVQMAFVAEQTAVYLEARKLQISTYEKYHHYVCENMYVEQEGDADFVAQMDVLVCQDEGTMREIIGEIHKGKSAEAAAEAVYRPKMNRLLALPDTEEYAAIKPKAELLRDHLIVLQHHLHPTKEYTSLRDAPDGAVVVAKTIPPAEMFSFVDRQTGGLRLAGAVLTEANPKGHTGLMAKSLGVPVAFVNPEHMPTMKFGYDAVIDGSSASGALILHPSAAVLNEFTRQRDILAQNAEALAQRHDSSRQLRTLDGTPVHVFGNFGASPEVPSYRKARVEEIGLLRIEMALNLRTDSAPEIDEDQWMKIIEHNLRECAGGDGYVRATIRTLDIAGDKAGKFAGKSNEEKAAYELKVTRTQMGSLARLNHKLEQEGHPGKIKIMIPMIASPDEMSEYQQMMDEIAAERNVPTIKLGCMGEVPALFDKLDKLDVAFMSIGSNDLIHFILEADRYSAGTASFYDPTDPSVLMALEKAAVFGKEKDIPISLCGDMASEARYVPLVIGAGIMNLSCALNSAPVTKEIASRIDVNEARTLFQLLKDTDRRADRERILDHFNATRLGLSPEGKLDMDWSEHTRRDFAPSSALPDREPGAPA
ncbi:MAG: hypothetical protein IPH06_04645 [Alphaproteobacteria bacterium]|nr:hypothetical protein [Alphaproteobacteria bacterium]QQS57316.1 MAG: hypothetical protein IPN28_00405 [Alphaproteobacteria bacterium]